jgi:isocitrate/isopropylmalate dehydrogenase
MILSAAMMLRHLAEEDAAASIERAVGRVLEERSVLTPDMGGTATTEEVARAVSRVIRSADF